MFTEDDCYGAKVEEIIGIINYVTTREDTRWTAQGDQRTGENNVVGITLRVRQLFHDKGLTRLSVSGNGWMVAFNVTRQRPRNLPADMPSITTQIDLANHPSVMKVHKGQGAMLTLHGLTMISPDQFRKEMALLRMFSSEWA